MLGQIALRRTMAVHQILANNPSLALNRQHSAGFLTDLALVDCRQLALAKCRRGLLPPIQPAISGVQLRAASVRFDTVLADTVTARPPL